MEMDNSKARFATNPLGLTSRQIKDFTQNQLERLTPGIL